MNENLRFGLVTAAVVLIAVGVVVWSLYWQQHSPPADTATASVALPQSDKEISKTPGEPADEQSADAGPIHTPATSTTARAKNSELVSPRPTGSGSIAGNVRWKEDESPAAGASITLELSNNDTATGQPKTDRITWTATTDQSGGFHIPRLPLAVAFESSEMDNMYAVMAQKDKGFGFTRLRLTDDESEGYVEIELEEEGSISGRVVNESSQPVSGALVFPDEGKKNEARVYADGTALRAVTDDEGRFSAEHLRDATWTLTVRSERYAVAQSAPVPLNSDDVMITLSEGAAASGIVIQAENGEPVPDTTIVASSRAARRGTRSASTASDGTFSIPALTEGTYQLSLQDDDLVILGYPSITVDREKDINDVKVIVAMGAVVTGRVYDADTEEPVAGANIKSSGPQCSRTAISDDNGNYRLAGLAEGTHTLLMGWKAGYPRGDLGGGKTVSVQLGQDVSGVDLPMRRGLRLRGIVVASEGQPIPRVLVVSHALPDSEPSFRAQVPNYGRPDNLEGDRTWTKNDGTFEHYGFSEGAQVVLQAQRNGYVRQTITDLVIGPEGLDNVKIVMEPGASIAGTVVDTHNEPLSKISVTARVPGPSLSAGDLTDGDGKFKLDNLAAGSYSIYLRRNDAQHGGDTPSGGPITVSKEQELTGVQLVFKDDDKGLTISGRILNSHREPLRDATIYVNQTNREQTNGRPSEGDARSDEDGRYQVPGLQDVPHRVSAHHRDYSSARAENVMGGAKNVDFVLEDSATIEGRVVDARTGHPLTMFQLIHLSGTVEKLDRAYSSAMTTSYYEDGNFKLAGVNAGDVTLVARADGYALTFQVLNGIRPGQNVTGIEILLPESATVTGMVVDSSGAPVAGAQVFVGDVPARSWDDEQSPAATTDKNGEFSVTSLAPGPTNIIVQHRPFPVTSMNVDLLAGQSTQIEFRLAAGAIEGTVRLRGKPVPRQRVSARRREGDDGGFATTDANGYYNIPNLNEGEYNVEAWIEQEGTSCRGQRTAMVQGDMVTQVDFNVAADDAAIEGTVTVNGQPASTGGVSASVTAGNATDSISTRIAPNGDYRLEGLPAGATKLLVAVQDAGATVRRTVPVEAVRGRTVRCDVEIDAGLRVSGTISGLSEGDMGFVVLLKGKVTVNAVDYTFGSDMGSQLVQRAHVSPDGSYAFADLTPDTYTLVAFTFNTSPGTMNMENARFVAVTTTVSDVESVVNLKIP